MSGIVERLRSKPMLLTYEAAAEIERLREENNALRLVATSHEPEALRLRAALQEIADLSYPVSTRAPHIASRALEPRP